MQKSNRYTFESRIRYSETDHRKRLTLPGLINYFQDCSIFQSEMLGQGIEYLKKHGRAWVLLSWQIVINRYPELNEKVRISTWATEFRGMLGNRNFCMEDEEGHYTAYANSQWMYMDIMKGRPARPESEIVEAYGTGQALEMECDSRKIIVPENMQEYSGIPVRRHHLDTNEHVNNCQYVQMAMDLLEGEHDIRQIRTEYRKAAVLGDMIIPKTAEEEQKAAVKLCDAEGRPYAVVEVKWV